ncbi:MAG: ion transporter [Proteobacteria bacterium]|nr:ion transporter [Pseudomonadota bacterium]
MSPLHFLWIGFHDSTARAHRWTEGVVGGIVLLSIALFVVELSVDLPERAATWLAVIDRWLLWFFVVEICLRVLSFRPIAASFLRRGPLRHVLAHVTGRLRFLISPMMVVDLMAVLAVYPALRSLRALRLLRVVRGLHLFRYHNPFEGISRAFRDNRVLYTFTFSTLGVLVLVGGLSLYLIERHDNPALSTVADGLWWGLVTITTVGFGDVTPQTGLGRAVGSVLMLAGMFMLALSAGVVGHTLLNAVLTIREEQFRMSGYMDHIVVCGYEDSAHMLLDRLLEENASRGRQLVVFGPGNRPERLRSEYIWVAGDPTKESELDKVRMSHAAATIIVGARSHSPQQADALSILTTFTIRHYLRHRPISSERARPLYVVCEILDAENVDHARAAGADEVIETTRLGFSLLAHAISMPGTATAMSRMAGMGDHSLYVGKLNGDAPRRFGELSEKLRVEHRVLLIGYRREDGEEVINPANDVELDISDRLLYLAEGPVLSS